MDAIRPIVSVPRDAESIARVLALLIELDVRAGAAVTPPDRAQLRFRRETRDWWSAPEEVARRGWGDCADLVRLVGASRGDSVGVVRTPQGWHAFLLTRGAVDDPCVDYGAPRPSPAVYAGAAYAPICRPEDVGAAGIVPTNPGIVPPAIHPTNPGIVPPAIHPTNPGIVPPAIHPTNPGIVPPAIHPTNPGIVPPAIHPTNPGIVPPAIHRVNPVRDAVIRALQPIVDRLDAASVAQVPALAAAVAGAAVAAAEGEDPLSRAAEVWATATDEAARDAAAAVVWVLAPEGLPALRARLQASVEDEGDLSETVRLVAAVAALRALGIALPIDQPRRDPGVTVYAAPEVEVDLEGLAARVGCPGACARRR